MKERKESCFPGRFDPGQKRWVPAQDSHESPASLSVERIRVATYNTWFGELCQRQRHRAIFDILRQSQADVIGLQEMIPESLEHLLKQDWIRADYYCSDILGITVDPYGVVLLSRLPFQRMVFYDLPSLMNRKLLVSEHVIHGQSLQIGTVHLESLRPSARTRGQQLEIILSQLKKSDHAVLMGDCNFCSSWEEENRRVDPEFHDLWPLLRKKEMGYTIDTLVNRMKFQQEGEDKRTRYDRIFLRSRRQAWQARHIELLGTEPLPGLPEIWPSDHLGLLAELRWDD